MMVCKVNLSFLFGFLKLWVQSLRLGMASACLATAICRLGKGLASGQYLSSTMVYLPNSNMHL
eukprot:1149088-Pelagomonas_calceolata.AAC.1